MTSLLFTLLLIQTSPLPAGEAKGIAAGVVYSQNGIPSAGVRVFAIPAGDTQDAANNPIVFESLAQTDATGHYRLELPTGRYYIAAGSVESPTYFPDTTAISSAKQILISAGTVIDSINFSKYVAVSQSRGASNLTFVAVPQPPNSTGVLSGFIRFPDGKAAPGVRVIAVPLSTLSPGTTQFVTSPSAALSQSNNLTAAMLNTMPAPLLSLMRLVRGTTRATTDMNGRYRLENVPPDIYYIMAGNADSPVFYPATNDIASASAITTIATTKIDTLDMTIASPVKGVSIRGRTSGMTGEAAANATIEIHSLAPPESGMASLLPGNISKPAITGADGSYEISGVPPGSYSLLARLPGAPQVAKNVVVSDQPVELELTFPAAVFTARILWEDGSPVSLPLISEVAVSKTSTSNLFDTAVFPAELGGAFAMALEAGQYRFFVRDLPQGYTIKSIRSGTTDLIREPLDVGHTSASDVEVRIAKASGAAAIIRGKVLDAASGRPIEASPLQLCCFSTGPIERLSSTTGVDGSFEFSAVPAGQYTAELRVSPPARIVDPAIVVEDQRVSVSTLVASAQFVSVNLSVSTDGIALPPHTELSVTLAAKADSVKPEFRITKSGPAEVALYAFVPAGVQYTVTVSGLPEGLQVKSITSGTTDLVTGLLNIVANPAVPPVPTAVQITLSAREPQ